MQIFRVSEERCTSISHNLIIIRELLNIANGYVDNSNYLIEDRFAIFKDLLNT